MRIRTAAGAVLAGLVLSAPAWAVDPTQILRVPIAVPDVARPIAAPQQVQARNTSLASYLPRFMVPSNSSVFGQSVFPTADQLPGKSYLKAFGARKPKFFQID